jgi:hypothetical protein
MNLAAQIKAAVDTAFRERLPMAVVIDDSPLLIRINGESVDVPARTLSSYTPIVSDEVLVCRVGLDWVILGEVT